MEKNMTDRNTLGDRMKEYEATSQSSLLRRTPVIIRIDGRAFHTFTRCLTTLDPSVMQTPFSTTMNSCMVSTTAACVLGVQSAVLAYTQSDEISILLRDWDRHETQQWFGGNVQKMVSVSASIATAAFNFKFAGVRQPIQLTDMAQFDSRVYNIPTEEVANYFLWRQQDASRNSVQMLGRYYFSAKQMHGKNNSEVQDMLMLERGVNWNDLPTWMKRGTCISRERNLGGVVLDTEIPIFSQDRNYINKHLILTEE